MAAPGKASPLISGRHPDDHLSVVVLCNRAGANADYIANVVAGHYIPGIAPPTRSAAKINPAVLHGYAGNYRLLNRLNLKLVVVGDHLETTWLGKTLVLEPE